MKQELTCIVAIITVFIIGVFFGTKLEERKTVMNQIPGHPVFIWNDDLESIPSVHDLSESAHIEIEGTTNDTIYIGPAH